MKKIVVCQYWTKNLSYAQYTQAINEKYCNDNGYIYHVETDTTKIKTGVKDRAFTWYKPILIKDVMDIYDPDYILFLDADAIVCDFSYKIEQFIDENFDIICTNDYGPSRLNAGVFIMKNNDWVKDFLVKWWDLCDELSGGSNNEIGFYKNGLWHDQTTFGILMDRIPDVNSHISIISNYVLNGREFRDSRNKNFIFHAFSFGLLKNRTIDAAYYYLFDLPRPITNDLSDICDNYLTDKNYEHNYIRMIYSDLFLPLQKDIKTFIEIGIGHGSSIEMWRDYFVNSKVVGVDLYLETALDYFSTKKMDRIDLIKMDQSSPEELDKFSELYSNVDVILDDGSHKMYDQQITFAKLFKMLKSGGIYILEDLHTSIEAPLPEKSWLNWGDGTKTLTLNMLEEFVNTGILKSDYLTSEEMEYLNQNIKSVDIFRNRPEWSITSVIIKK